MPGIFKFVIMRDKIFTPEELIIIAVTFLLSGLFVGFIVGTLIATHN